ALLAEHLMRRLSAGVRPAVVHGAALVFLFAATFSIVRAETGRATVELGSSGSGAAAIDPPDAAVPIAAHRIRVMRGGTEIELFGGLAAGIAEELRAMLAHAPKARVVHLNSPGGRMLEGWKLYTLIRERGLSTYTSARCYSACTLAFLAG